MIPDLGTLEARAAAHMDAAPFAYAAAGASGPQPPGAPTFAPDLIWPPDLRPA